MKGKSYACRDRAENNLRKGDFMKSTDIKADLYSISNIVDISKKIYGRPLDRGTIYSWLSILGVTPIFLTKKSWTKFYDKNIVDSVLIKLFNENTKSELKKKMAELRNPVVNEQQFDTKSVYVNYKGEDFYRSVEYPSRIAVSKSGKVFSLFNQTLYKTSINPVSGYETLILMLQKPRRHTKTLYVHRLVAKNFIENPLNKKEVNHIDGNKTNNNVSNLEWVTGSENMFHSYRVLKRKLSLDGINKTRESQKVLTKEQVIFIKKHNDLTATKLCLILNIPNFRVGVVQNVKNGKSYCEYNYLLKEVKYDK